MALPAGSTRQCPPYTKMYKIYWPYSLPARPAVSLTNSDFYILYSTISASPPLPPDDPVPGVPFLATHTFSGTPTSMLHTTMPPEATCITLHAVPHHHININPVRLPVSSEAVKQPAPIQIKHGGRVVFKVYCSNFIILLYYNLNVV